MAPCRGRRIPAPLLLLLAVPALLVAGCAGESAVAPSPQDERPADGDWLVAALDSDPTTLRWVQAADRPTAQVGRLVADSLVALDLDLTFRPRLASRWEFSDDHKVLTLYLREDVRWHDGTPLTADDVTFTYELAMDPATGAGRYASLFAQVRSVKALDPLTVQVTHSEPAVTALQGWEALLILPRHRGESAGTERRVLGTGPFRLEEWKTGRELTLVAHDDYWGGRPHLDRIVFRIIPDAHTRFEALRTGEIDLTSVAPADWPIARSLPSDGPLHFLRFQYRKVYFIAWNGDGSNPFFADPRVRRAMTHALDRQGFVDTVLHGLGRVATSTFVPGTWAHHAGSQPLPYDREESARLLQQAGWSDGDGDGIRDRDGQAFRFTLHVYSQDANAQRLAELLQDSLRRLGIAMEIRRLELAAFLQHLRGRDFQAQMSAWTLDADPDPFDFWHSSQTPSGANYAGYADAEMDRLCEEGRREFDPGRRAALYAEVQELLQRDQPFTFLYHPLRIVGHHQRLRGIRAAPLGIWRWHPSTLEWWVPTALQRFPDAAGAAQDG
jgi:peptide/nickel transport system substrate-binding protein